MNEATGHHHLPGLVRLTGIFYRAADPDFRAQALAGSRGAARYSSAAQPTLYLSASRAGIDAAMMAHQGPDAPAREVLAFEVDADRIFDLRNEMRCRAVGIDPAAAAAPWQEVAAQGGEPPSWRVADRLRELGAWGLIDPSRKSPGLWHLVLFRWNSPGAPLVMPVSGDNVSAFPEIKFRL
jgi:RES domain-containing protein